MSKRIITISREFGSGGRFIGEELAKRLGYKYYDKELILKVAEKTGFTEEYVRRQGEYAASKSIFAYAFVGRTADGRSAEDYVFETQQKIIQDIADHETAVIIGRCADYILRDRDDVLNVFIYGDMPEKIARVREVYDRTEDEAIAMIKEMDKKRAINYQYCTDQKWGKRTNYDLCINTSALGYEKTIELLETLVR